jgi:hypothetical protein
MQTAKCKSQIVRAVEQFDFASASCRGSCVSALSGGRPGIRNFAFFILQSAFSSFHFGANG